MDEMLDAYRHAMAMEAYWDSVAETAVCENNRDTRGGLHLEAYVFTQMQNEW